MRALRTARPTSPTVLVWLLALLVTGCAGGADRPAAPEGETGPPTVDTEHPVASPLPRVGRPEDLPTDRPLRAAFLLTDGVFGTELTAPHDVLEHTASAVEERPPIEVFTVAAGGAPVRTAEGLVVTPDHGFEDHPPVDILVVPSAVGSREEDLEDERMIDWVRTVGGEARYVMSLCWGAFVLGEAGLLDGHAATTFPADYERFAERFPAVDLRVNVSFVHHGKVLTSQGGVRSFDVALYLVDLLYGEAVARRIGEGLLIPWPPSRADERRFTVEISPPAPAP